MGNPQAGATSVATVLLGLQLPPRPSPGKGSHSGGGRSAAVRRRKFQATGRGEEIDWISHRAERSAPPSVTTPLYVLPVGGSAVSCRRVYWSRSVTGAVRDLEPDDKHQRSF